MQEAPNVQLRLVSSNPFLRSANNRDALTLYISTHDYFLRKSWMRSNLYKASATPILRKLRTLNV